MTNSFRLGRLPNSGRPRIKLTVDLIPAAVYNPPASVDYYSHVPAQTWGMDGNDTVGDCTCAEVDHTTKARQVAAGNTEVKSSDAEVLKLYSEVTGYTPTDPNTDQGAEMQAVRDYWRKNGAVLGGKADKILLFAEVDHRDLMLVKWCVDRFGAVGLGVNFPASAMTQFDKGQPWDVVKGAKIEGGHAISMVGYDATYAYVVTWGRVQKMTWAFYVAYVEEAWTDLDESFVNSVSGADPLAETLHALGEQFAAVTGQANPVPAPGPQPQPAPTPTPTPVVGTTVTFTDAQYEALDAWADNRWGRGAKAAREAWNGAKASQSDGYTTEIGGQVFTQKQWEAVQTYVQGTAAEVAK